MGGPLTTEAHPTPAEPTTPLRIGVVGAGVISRAYLGHLDDHGRAAGLALTAVADLDPERAAKAAAGRRGVRALTPDELYAAEDVDLVLNLTVPAVHADVALAAIAAGKHVYNEKPLAPDRESGAAVLAAARAAGVRVGCAPDTVLGRGVQTARAAVAAGHIGQPVAATAFFTSPGHEAWHSDPEFYYRPGGGPLLDMGPYYLSALVHLLGPITAVTGAASRATERRTIGSGPRAGHSFPVEVDTHVTGVLSHTSGALTTLLMSFDTHAAHLPRIEVHGTGGSLSVPDPNNFEGPVALHPAGAGEWRELPPSAGYAVSGRGVGLADMARALRTGTAHRASGELGLHVLEAMEALLESAATGRRVEVNADCPVPPAVD
ncbi:Gfo/Idh/MocA family protein [Streptomyces litchfieldiae]|uniref:Gfo/Idh/MocA family oxidoreductase n=1 Tax=Streptomyces litchfieldiae TaxID=3075543 RepID=A0ABU2MWW3_9ACTN|nr:Gfo/Idh/MocA family oxidoreductase [Streptomyces sp. DSM 44938]MDT0345778.1 Gfo/Idh/MocA family oxidoreductase [Streptomyces sp. DSM 44938]